MGKAAKHAVDMAQYMRMQHGGRVKAAQAVLSRATGPKLVKNDTDVTIRKNAANAPMPTQAPKYMGQPNKSPNKNMDDRMGRLMSPQQKVAENRPLHRSRV